MHDAPLHMYMAEASDLKAKSEDRRLSLQYLPLLDDLRPALHSRRKGFPVC